MHVLARPMSLALLLAGCGLAGQNQPPAPALPAAALDGIYDGRATRELADTADCPPAGPGMLEVGDATLVYGADAATVFDVPLAAGGRLHAQSGGAVLDGSLNGDRLAFSVSKPGCRVSYDLERLPGF
jgi:hypothetical protein